MAYKNTAITITYLAWDTANNVGKTGDGANHTLRGVGDGTEYTPSSPSITEVDSTNCPGLYKASLTAGENNYTNVTLHGKSSSSSIVIIPTRWQNETSADAVKLGGTAQTGRDIGASVLLSPGTGTGQLDFTSGVVKANLVQILATALTETAGQIAGAFKKFFNVASPTLTCLGIDQTGDNYARLGAPAGASVSADVAAVKSDTAAIKAKTDNLPATPAATGDAMSLTTLQSPNLESGTAQAGGASTITLRSGASATDSLYRGQEVEIYGGTGAGQARIVTAYVGSTKVATVDEAWITQPDATSTYRVTHRGPKLDSSQRTTDVNSANLDAAVSSRLATSGYTAPDNTSISAIKTKTDQLTFTLANKVDSSIQAAGDFAQAAADKVWSSATRTLTSFGTLAQDIWDKATSALTTVGSIGKLLVTDIDATISSRLATSGYTAPDNTSITAIKAKTDNLPASPAAVSDIPTSAQVADKLLGRNLAGGSDGGRTVTESLRPLRNKIDAVSVPGSVLIMAEDDTTESWRAALTTDAAALPIVEIDPA